MRLFRTQGKTIADGPPRRAARRAAILLLLALLPALWYAWSAGYSENGKPVALTFDDGPVAPYTGRILDVLDEEKVRATFFFLGQNAERQPALAKSVAARGHEIGSHTYLHPSLKNLPRAAVAQEIVHGRQAVQAATGVRVNLFRCPYGDEPPFLRDLCRDLGLTLIPFGVSGKDWQAGSSREIADMIVKAAYPGAILLLHDGSTNPDADRSHTVEAARLIIRALKARGYRFVTVSEVLPTRTGIVFIIRRLLVRAWPGLL